MVLIYETEDWIITKYPVWPLPDGALSTDDRTGPIKHLEVNQSIAKPANLVFHLFPNLPPELRRKMWKQALPASLLNFRSPFPLLVFTIKWIHIKTVSTDTLLLQLRYKTVDNPRKPRFHNFKSPKIIFQASTWYKNLQHLNDTVHTIATVPFRLE